MGGFNPYFELGSFILLHCEMDICESVLCCVYFFLCFKFLTVKQYAAYL